MFSFERSLRRLIRDVESRKHRSRYARLRVETLEDRSVPATFYQGFEDPSEVQTLPTTTPGWNFSTFTTFQGTTRVPSGTGGITSLGGSWHAVDTAGLPTSATDWGGYSSVFPTGGYRTLTYFYLDVSAGHANDTRFDYSSAINDTLGSHRRDFIFHVGFYDSADLTGPGAGTNRFIFSVSHNAPGDPKNGIGGPPASFHISTTGWYGLEHRFYDAGGGQLACDFILRNSSGTALNTWTLTPTIDIIGVTVGGNRYGWILNNGFSSLAFDESAIFIGPPNVAYVSPTWGSLAPNTPILDADFGTAGNQPAVFGVDAFTTIAAAQAAVGASGTIIVNAGSYAATTLTGTQTLEITGPDAAQAVTISSLTTSAGQTVIIEGSSTLTVGDATSTTIAGVISGTGNLVKQGIGTLTLSGINTYTGTTTVNAGTLVAANNSALGTTAGGTTIASGATLDVQANIGTEALTSAGSILTSTGTGTVGGTVTLTGNTTIGGNGTLNLNGIISGAFSITKNGTGTTTLAAANTYTGTTTVNAGTLTLAGGAAIVDTGAVIVNGGTLNLAASETIGSLAGNAGTSVTLNNFTLTTGDSSSTTFAGVISGTGGLVKQGSGTFTLSGANTYSGQTTINAGELKLSGSLTGAGLGVVLNGAGVIFSGNGTGQLTGAGRGVTVNGTATNSKISGLALIHNTTAGTTGVDILNGATVRVLSNTINATGIGNNVSVDGSNAKLYMQGNTLNGSGTSVGLRISGGAIVDAGQKAGGFDFTGLNGGGVGQGSTGGNSFQNFSSTAPAIRNLNTNGANALAGPQGAPVDTYAQNNTFNAITPGTNYPGVEALVDHDYDNSGRGFVNYITPSGSTPVLVSDSAGSILLYSVTPTAAANNNWLQRSMIRRARLSFSDFVFIASGAVSLTRNGGTYDATGGTYSGAVTVNLAGPVVFDPNSSTGRYFNYDFGFSGANGVEVSGSLVDGSYTMTLTNSGIQAYIQPPPSIATLQLGGGSGSTTINFHRLFGDFNNSGKVLGSSSDNDLAAFNAALRSIFTSSNYREYFDFDNDRDVDGGDQNQFNRRLNRY